VSGASPAAWRRQPVREFFRRFAKQGVVADGWTVSVVGVVGVCVRVCGHERDLTSQQHARQMSRGKNITGTTDGSDGGCCCCWHDHTPGRPVAILDANATNNRLELAAV